MGQTQAKFKNLWLHNQTKTEKTVFFLFQLNLDAFPEIFVQQEKVVQVSLNITIFVFVFKWLATVLKGRVLGLLTTRKCHRRNNTTAGNV